MEMVVDLIMQAPLSDVDVCEDPILVPSCGHALTMSTLDSLMEMNNYYKGDADPNTGTVSFVQTKTLPNHEVPIVGCPSCRAPISGLMRYGRRIRHSQLVMRLKKFEISQDADAISAETNFTVAQAEIEKATPSFLKKLLTPSPTSSKSSSDKKKDLPRPLGKVPKGSMFPNSDVRTLVHSYGILSKNEMAWKELIKPALEVLKAFDKIREKAAVSPGRRLYEASVAHLYRFKSEVFYVDSAENGSTTVQWQQGQTEQMMAECARECGLSPDGQSGSSLVRSIQGRFNVMQVILHAAQQVLEHKSSGGINSGWYLFVEDLIQCCLAHARIQRDTASKGNYPRIETYANMSLLDVYYRQMQWIGLRPFDNTDQVQLQTRQKAADAVLGPFMDTLRWIKINENIGLRNECLPKARDYESRMVTAYKIALQQIQSPLTKDEKLQVFRAIQAKLGGSGHWYQCPNGHSYVIGECGGAMQESVCPECGASIGGRSHSLRSDNRRDQEFESMYRQGR
ncbi:hypothetical protein BGZ73_000816 [Actinomortierella ambigua]|nr:hypothetical protein BGZ73_000816 [Actinomortierella ambigua]